MLSSSHKFCIKQKEVILDKSLVSVEYLLYLLASKAYLAFIVVEPNGVEPLTSCVQGRRSTN